MAGRVNKDVGGGDGVTQLQASEGSVPKDQGSGLSWGHMWRGRNQPDESQAT